MEPELKQIGQYEIRERLAEGGFGVVYLAHDPRLDRDVAVKILHSYHASEPARVARFVREARSAARFCHPGIVQIYDVVQEHGRMALVMELVQGVGLDRFLKQHPNLHLVERIEIAAQIAETLDAAHRQGIIHRDVKPANVLITPDGRVKLTDFSLARLVDSSLTPLTGENNVLGTPAYMSPEQCLGQDAVPQSDIYSLGVILYEMATGHLPFEAENYLALMRQHMETPPTPLRLVRPSLPITLENVVMFCLAKVPDKRPANGADLALALRTVCTELTAPAPAPETIDPSTSKTIALDLRALEKAEAQARADVLRNTPYTPQEGVLHANTPTTANVSPHSGIERLSPHKTLQGLAAADANTPRPAETATVSPHTSPLPALRPETMAAGAAEPAAATAEAVPQETIPPPESVPVAPAVPVAPEKTRSQWTWPMIVSFMGITALAVLSLYTSLLNRQTLATNPLANPAPIVTPPAPATDATATPKERELANTPLTDYVRKEDDNFQFKIHSTAQGVGYTAHTLDLTSQTWHADKVAPPVWRHWLTIIVPDKVMRDTALLVLSEGLTTPEKPMAEVPVSLIASATSTKSVVAILEGFPRDPIHFLDASSNEGESRAASTFDEFTADSFQRFLETGDTSWPVVCPLVKSVVRTMDAVQKYVNGELKTASPVNSFVLTGAANGWGIWLAGAVDARVRAFAPIAFDLVGIGKQIQHQIGMRGEMTPFINLLSDMDLLPMLDSNEGERLLNIVDPYSYRNYLTIPKLLILPASSSNPYTTMDGINEYIGDLRGPTNLYCVPNLILSRGNPLLPQPSELLSTKEEGQETVKPYDFRDTLQVFYHKILVNKPMPEYSWNIGTDGSFEVKPMDHPAEARLWLAKSNNRDFRYETEHNAWKMETLQESVEGGYKGRIKQGPERYTAFYIELIFPSMLGTNYSLTTPVTILTAQNEPTQVEPARPNYYTPMPYIPPVYYNPTPQGGQPAPMAPPSNAPSGNAASAGSSLGVNSPGAIEQGATPPPGTQSYPPGYGYYPRETPPQPASSGTTAKQDSLLE